MASNSNEQQQDDDYVHWSYQTIKKNLTGTTLPK